jgi:hypothetical protein
MALLIKIRNDLIHYKMSGTPPKYIKPLEERGIILPSHEVKQGDSVDFPWPHKLSCSEGIRWAHNTVCETVDTLVKFIPKEIKEKFMLLSLSSNFRPIAKSDAIDWFKSRGIDPGIS